MPSAPPSPQHGERCACCAQLNTATTTSTFSGGCYDDKGAFSGGCYDEKGDKIVAGYNAEMASLQAKMTLLQAEKASLLAEKASLKAEIAQCAEDKTNASTSNCPAGCVSVNATQRRQLLFGSIGAGGLRPCVDFLRSSCSLRGACPGKME